MAKKIYIGSSNFAELITENAVFVDKSLLIRDIIEDTSKVILITRPRRFGKTLNMSIRTCHLQPLVDFELSA
ncbi:AAA family ATPase [Caedibacter taeniospiralis]|uniref:AAA family ATPase n=1 Tax=Caedibacter taeniospiralis TaxID=28907 RepID=UPI000C27951B|nr:AAA family ATPase [Caedibacter taeniospiralis]